LVLDLVDLDSIVLEQDGVFGVQSILQVISVEDTLEFSKEIQGCLDVSDNLEVFINILLKFSLNGGNINFEVYEISIESVAC